MRRAGAILSAALCACGDGGGETGIDLTIRYDPALGLDRFALAAEAGGEALIERTLLPDDEPPLDESGREGVPGASHPRARSSAPPLPLGCRRRA